MASKIIATCSMQPEVCARITELFITSFGFVSKMLPICKKAFGFQRHLYRAMSSYSSFVHNKAYINGEWISSQDGKMFKVTNPANGDVIGEVPDIGPEDTQKAIDAAHKAFYTWKKTTARERSKILKKWFQLMEDNKSALAELLTLEQGKTLSDAATEVTYGASFFEWFAEEAKRVYGDIAPPTATDRRILLLKEPIGVAGLITPWNFPIAMITRKLGALLAVGCTTVIKPAEDTPLSALALCQLAEEAGVPAGVVNVVTSSREKTPTVGKLLCESPKIATISFTGSTGVGKKLLLNSASTVKRLSLELGGNAAFIVFNSADIDKAISGAMACKFRCSGQTCVCANRFLVQSGIHDEFVRSFAKAIETNLKVGDGLKPGITMGPLINSAAVDKVDSLVQDALSKGARKVFGGEKLPIGENFFQPTLLSDVTTDMRCANEEIFGPLAPVIKFETEDEAVALANSTSYGLAGYFYSTDISQIWRVAEKLETGIVGVNESLLSAAECPFGGVKESGIG
ncbi:succinate-semialdehyde dehydrogenase, mitochondrial-like isoform X2 [Octopus vulgaris]|uniref:Succinate-semialdehyde dehydrogenase n=1 Tax=Octopus vulgaris TaxID=6645 RepID=A0AA36ARJ5_OCTVU|nr:succinate-semialdehyde dehydrogenase, mitochondrial-like isoform X2 [Octopus vulgaris]